MSKRRPEHLLALTGLLLVASTSAWGQVTVTPRATVSETITDNVGLDGSNPRSEQITEITPGIRISIAGTRLNTYFDLGLSQVIYAQGTSPDRRQIQNALNTFGTFEAVDNWAFVDFSGTVSQQAVSAFGTQSASNTSVNANQAEVSNYRISPYLRGRLFHAADYEARYSRTTTRSDAAAASDVDSADTSVRLSGNSAFRNLGWSTDASRQTISYSEGRTTETDRVNLGLTYTLTPQLNVSASAGRESNNFTTRDKESSSTHSVSLNWRPSELTRLSATRSQRPFGDAHNVSFEHRSARTVWRFTDSRDVTTTPSQTGFGSIGAVYDLLFSQFASIEPDPIARAALVDAYLQANGISPSANVVSQFLSSAVSLQRSQNLSFSLLGQRDTITFVATRTESTRLDTLATSVDDLATASKIRQQGFSINFAHRLTPDYSLGVLWSQQNTSGDNNTQDTRLRSANVNLTGRIGKRASAAVGLRHVVFDGLAPYTENALTGNLNVQF
ncbi:MAG: TIGR03016 family PEP-CTERM system-associated outer membrane protein [Comamonadaceae bacterium]|nr:TIGR03016 family PEP-CTERM system-associated outer membrane protein [Comamonadaceae bacterium]